MHSGYCTYQVTFGLESTCSFCTRVLSLLSHLATFFHVGLLVLCKQTDKRRKKERAQQDLGISKGLFPLFENIWLKGFSKFLICSNLLVNCRGSITFTSSFNKFVFENIISVLMSCSVLFYSHLILCRYIISLRAVITNRIKEKIYTQQFDVRNKIQTKNLASKVRCYIQMIFCIQ